MGRPSSKPKKLRDGFYLEIRSKGSNTGVKIRRDTEEQMLAAVDEYKANKVVIVMGEYKNGKSVKED